MNPISPHTVIYTVRILVRVYNDILLSLDQQKAVSLILLDLSAAFETIHHNMLLDRLADIGIQVMAHKWFQSYVQNSHQLVSINVAKSNSVPLRYGVPQGSVLGPFLFTQMEKHVGNMLSATSYMMTTPRFM